MARCLTLVLLALVALPALALGRALDPDDIHPLLPTPYYFTNGTRTLAVNANAFRFALAPGATASSEVLCAAAARYTTLMFAWGEGGAPGGSALAGCAVAVVNGSDAAFQLLDDESYTLTVSTAGGCALTAPTVWGALRGLETLSQLIEYSPAAEAYELRMAPWSITDRPTFPQRGLLIDTARHWLTMPTLLRQIDALAYNKMNTLHWHAVDGDSFPIVSESFPKLASLGSFSESIFGPGSSSRRQVGMYSVAEQEQVVQYARMRGVRVMIEFDLPGHASAWAAALPEIFIKCKPGMNGDFNGSSFVIDPTLPATWAFLDTFIGEFVKRFPDKVMHLGGDEVNTGCLNGSSSVRAWMKQRGTTDFRDVYIYFERQIHALGAKHGKDVQTWADSFRSVHNASIHGHGAELPKSSIAQEWGNWVDAHGQTGPESGADEVRDQVISGQRSVRSSGFYFNSGFDGGSPTVWEAVINAQIIPPNLTKEQQSRVLGAEACMWGEVTDEFYIDQKVWLRTSVLAERLWTRNETINRDCGNMPCTYGWSSASIQARMVKNRCRLVQRGILAQPYSTQIIPSRNKWSQCELWLPESWRVPRILK